MRTLLVTNDFPPRAGGIQAYLHGFVSRQPEDSLVVYAPAWQGAAAFDAAAPFPVVRHPGSLMLPVPEVARRARELVRAERCDTVWFGASAPLGLLAPTLRRAGVQRVVASTHGHEVGWALLPGSRQVLRRIATGADTLTYLGGFTRDRLAPLLGAPGAEKLVWLPSGVDTSTFRPGAGGEEIRRRHHLGERPLAVCISRLVPRKGQDQLIRAWPQIRSRVPGAALLLVGGGPDRGRLERLIREHQLLGDVVLTGSVPWEELPAHYDAGDVFAMPCRSRRAGLEVEGLGIVFLEASATGLPVVAGDSGGAPDTVREGRTGHVVDGRSLRQVADRVADLLADPLRARALGDAGRAWTLAAWRWDLLGERLTGILAGEPVPPHSVAGVPAGSPDSDPTP